MLSHNMDIAVLVKKYIQRIQGALKPSNAATSASESVRKRAGGLYLSDRLSPKEIEAIYVKMLTSNFYDSNYGAEWNREPYRLMADIIEDIFKPKHLIDLGCGLGFVIEALREKT